VRFLAVLLALAAAAGCAHGDSGSDAIGAYLEEQAAAGFSGAVLVRRGDDTLVERGLGLADRERGIPVAPETVFSIGSITKEFTAATVLRLAELGRLRVDDPLPRFLDGVPADKHAITVRQLLRHRSGLPEYSGLRDFERVSRADGIRTILDLPLVFAPGTQELYSNPGYTLLAAIVEEASGRTWEQAVREHVYVPAGMTRSGFYGERRRPSAEVAIGYEGSSAAARNAPDGWGPASWSLKGAGGAVSTAGDLARWVDALRGGRLLRASSRAIALPDPRGVLAYGGANMFGFNAVVHEAPDALVVVLSNSSAPRRLRADEVGRGLERLLFGTRGRRPV
jgi:CubicO group peptidase (beta-lactamase class C family)